MTMPFVVTYSFEAVLKDGLSGFQNSRPYVVKASKLVSLKIYFQTYHLCQNLKYRNGLNVESTRYAMHRRSISVQPTALIVFTAAELSVNFFQSFFGSGVQATTSIAKNMRLRRRLYTSDPLATPETPTPNIFPSQTTPVERSSKTNRSQPMTTKNIV